ncbi:ribosomal protein L49/IMG2 [Mycena capillaripes]|nr:ribosomal protein L49/IMG2 [Mycena capillaripes]
MLKPSIRQYFVPRNIRHHLPVYTEFRSGGAQCFILIKNIQGHPPALAKDLTDSLFDSADPAASRMRVEQHSNRLVIKGARPDWKDRVVDWLRERGF